MRFLHVLRRGLRAWLRVLPRQIAVVAGGLIIYAAFPPRSTWYLAPLGVAVVILAITAARPGRVPIRGGFGYGYLAGMGFLVPLLPWVGMYVGPLAWWGLALVEALFIGLFGAAVALLYRSDGRMRILLPVGIAACWSAAEWLRATVPFGGFPWGRLAFSQPDGFLISIVRLGGAPLLSFAVALIGAGLAVLAAPAVDRISALAAFHRDGRTSRRAASERPGDVAEPADSPDPSDSAEAEATAQSEVTAEPARLAGVRIPSVVVALVAVVAPLATGAVMTPMLPDMDSGPQITAAAVQGNVPRLGLDFNAQRRAVLDLHVTRTLELADDIDAGREPQPDVVVWPENASDIDPLRDADAAADITHAADRVGAPILVGAVLLNDDGTTTNSVLVWNPGTGPADRHDKMILQPFGEYMPYRDFFRNFSSYVDDAGHFVPGHDDGLVGAGGAPAAVATCFEGAFDHAYTAAVREGAQFLTAPSNNATFSPSEMTYQQLAMSRLRSVEYGRANVLPATSGVSAIIGPDGGVEQSSEVFEPAALVGSIPLRTETTPATAAGAWPEYAIVGVAVLSLAAATAGWAAAARRESARKSAHE